MNSASDAAVSSTVTNGVFFSAVVQGRDITVTLPPQVTPAMAGLPPTSATFTGRDELFAQLLAELAPGEEEQPALVAAVAGMAGIGKTELVVQVATRALREPGWFPGGVLFVDMFGYDAQRRLTVDEALLGLLQAVGMPGEHIPAARQDRSRLLRSVLAAYAAQHRRLLLVIDNVASEEQVRPLIPSDGNTATLISSRHTLDIGARLYDLEVLDLTASVLLLSEALHQARGVGDTRVEDQPDSAREIAALCAGLPLALRISAALLADTPSRPLSSLAHSLRDAHTRLDRLGRHDQPVRAAFDLSHQRLTAPQARLFRLLAVNPGPDIGTEACAHLIDADLMQAENLLQDLARAHLIDVGATWGRWRVHDLVRFYAEEHTRAYPGERDTAYSALVAYYLTGAEDADSHLNPTTTPAPRFKDRADALGWLEAERPNLLAAATYDPGTSTRLVFSLARFLHLRLYFDDLITFATTAVDLFREFDDRAGEAGAWNNLGAALQGVRRFEEAITAHRRAAGIFCDLGDRYGEGRARNCLGLALKDARRFDEAITAAGEAASIFRELGDRYGEGRAWNSLGLALKDARRFDEAITATDKAASIFRELGDRYGEGRALDSLGLVLREVRRFEEAIAAHRRAAGIFRDLGDRHGEGRAWNNLGAVLQGMRRLNEAITARQRAVRIFRETGDRHGEGMALHSLGKLLADRSRLQEARTVGDQAVRAFAGIGDRVGVAVVRQWLDGLPSVANRRADSGG